MNRYGLAFCLALLAACAAGCAGRHTASMIPSAPNAAAVHPHEAPYDAVEALYPNSKGVIQGAVTSGYTSAMAVIVSGSGDRTGISGLQKTVVTLGTGKRVNPNAVPAARIPQMPGPYAVPESQPRPDEERAIRTLAVQHAAVSPAALYIVPPNTFKVGDERSLWVGVTALGSSKTTYKQVKSVVEKQTTHGTLWIDASLESGPTASKLFQGETGTRTISALSILYENAYASDTAHFAPATYTNTAPAFHAPGYGTCAGNGQSNGGAVAQVIGAPKDKRINVLVLNSKNVGAGVAGYFTAVNYVAQAVWDCQKAGIKSNQLPMIYLAWPANANGDYELNEDMVRDTAHELQHLINFVNHSVLAAGAATSNDVLSMGEEPFIDEGLSMLAQDFAVNRVFPKVPFDVDDAMYHGSFFLGAPWNYTLSGFTGLDGKPYGDGKAIAYNCGGGCYGLAYLFERYMYDRWGGDRYTKGMEKSGLTGFANLSNITYTEQPQQLFQEFALAMGARTMAIDVYPGSQWDFGSLDFTKSYTDQFGKTFRAGGLVPSANAKNGSAWDVASPVGGFAYVNLVSPSGMKFSLTDKYPTRGFGLNGGLDQI